MPLPFLSDLADILNLEEFAVAASYSRKDAMGDSTVNGVFDNETVPVDAGGFASVHEEQPRFTCRTADLPYLTENDILTVSGTTYLVRAWVHDGTGVTALQLERT